MAEAISRGSLVEFSDHLFSIYPPEDYKGLDYRSDPRIRFGVSTGEQKNGYTVVKIADGSEVPAKYIYASEWLGWIPEGLEEIYEQLNPDTYPEEW